MQDDYRGISSPQVIVYGMIRGSVKIKFESADVDEGRAEKALIKVQTFIRKLQEENPEVASIAWERE